MERQNTSGSVVVRIYLDDPGHGAMAVPAEDSNLSQGEQIQDRFAVRSSLMSDPSGSQQSENQPFEKGLTIGQTVIEKRG